MTDIFKLGRHASIGFDSIEPVYPDQEVEIVAQPCCLFKGERLAIPASIASCFQIVDIRVGMISMFLDTNPIPAQVFESPREIKDSDRLVHGERFDLIPCTPGRFIIIRARNIDAAPYRFLAAIHGRIPAVDRKSTRLNSSHIPLSRMPSSA